MTIEFIPSPSQLIALLDAGLCIKCTKSVSHRFYYVYIDDVIADFTADLMGVNKVSASLVNTVAHLAEALREWDNNFHHQQFQTWRMDYNQKPNVCRI